MSLKVKALILAASHFSLSHYHT